MSANYSESEVTLTVDPLFQTIRHLFKECDNLSAFRRIRPKNLFGAISEGVFTARAALDSYPENLSDNRV